MSFFEAIINFFAVIEDFIQNNIIVASIAIIIFFIILAKCADIFVDSAIALALKFKIPKLVIGIVLVSLATTAPELTVSLMSSLRGSPEIALGNAVGSVICDDGLALALAGLIALTPILISRRILKTTGLFLVFIEILAFLFVAFDFSLNRWEGAILVFLFILYIIFLFYQHKKGKYKEDIPLEEFDKVVKDKLSKIILLFFIGVLGIIISSEGIITAAKGIALFFRIPEAVIALILIALGTSIPEVATCIAAARKNEGLIAVGNILGADIMNICWVAGASAIANDLTLSQKQIYFMFPAMFIIVAVMLISIRIGYKLTKIKSLILLILYVIYILATFFLFPPHIRL